MLQTYSYSCQLLRDHRTTEKTCGVRAQAIAIELDRGLRSLCARITRYEECERPRVTGCTYEDFGLVTAAKCLISNKYDAVLERNRFYEAIFCAHLLIFCNTFLRG